MKQKLSAGIALILLVFFACTKQSNQNGGGTTSRMDVTTSSPGSPLSPAVTQNLFSFDAGSTSRTAQAYEDWWCYYDWGCTGSEPVAGMRFYADGTFKTSEGADGKWYQANGAIMWIFSKSNNGYKTTYSGKIVNRDAAQGVMVGSYNGDDGCFTLVHQAKPSNAPAAQNADMEGKPIK